MFMNTALPIENQTFKNIQFSEKPFSKGEYDTCVFLNCDFSNTNLSNIDFIECEFVNCNLSNIQLKNTGLKEVVFDACKMIGVNFEVCNPFLLNLRFTGCQLDFSSFYRLKLNGTNFGNCSFEEVDFTEADLTKAVFEVCDFKKAVFEKTNVQQADFYTAFNYYIDPENNQLKKAKFSKEGALGLLEKYQILVKD